MAGAIDPEILKTANRYIQVLKEKKIAFQGAWLFGSWAEGRATSDSDIDIAVLMKDVEIIFLKEVELAMFRRGIDSRIEPHIITPDEPNQTFVREIVEQGIKIA